MRKTVFVVEGLPAAAERYLHILPDDQYTVVRCGSADVGESIRGRVRSGTASDPFVFVMGKDSFRRETVDREIARAVAAAGVTVEPVFLVLARSFSPEEVSAVLERGNLFVLPRAIRRNGTPAGAFGFRVALDKVFVDYERNRRLASYVADDLVSFLDRERLRLSKEEVERLNLQLAQQNRVDELTSLLNRKGILESLRIAKGRASRERWRLASRGGLVDPRRAGPGGDIHEYFGHLACMMIDIDHFKHINDTYGHLVGDEVLRAIGRLFRREGIFRSEDVCGRFGGEEFIVILPATSATNALVPAEKFRTEFKQLVFVAEDGEEFKATVSIGISELEDSEETIEELIGKADAALYRAKETGRDRVVIYDEATVGQAEAAHTKQGLEDLEELGDD